MLGVCGRHFKVETDVWKYGQRTKVGLNCARLCGVEKDDGKFVYDAPQWFCDAKRGRG